MIEALEPPVAQIDIDWSQLKDLKSKIGLKQKMWFPTVQTADEESEYYLEPTQKVSSRQKQSHKGQSKIDKKQKLKR